MGLRFVGLAMMAGCNAVLGIEPATVRVVDAGTDSGTMTTVDAGPPKPNGLALGFGHTCVLDTAGVVRCVGLNDRGQLGVSGGGDRVEPVVVALEKPAVEIGAGLDFSCARLEDGSVWCWGGNEVGQLGATTAPTGTATPKKAVLPRAATQLTVGGGINGIQHACARLDDGSAWCWGGDATGSLCGASSSSMPSATSVTGVKRVIAGHRDTCMVVVSSDAVVCCGEGKFGDPKLPAGPTPVTVSGLSAVTLGFGEYHVCAETPDGHVLCWGSNAQGQIGLGASQGSGTPVFALDGRSPVGGWRHTCALDPDGNAFCAGLNGDGMLGREGNDSNVYVRVAHPRAMKTIASGWSHVCAIDTADEVWCWGLADHGQIGDGVTGKGHHSATPAHLVW